MVDAGMAGGMSEGYERLDELLETQLKGRHDTNG
jgi:hypothetical protein